MNDTAQSSPNVVAGSARATLGAAAGRVPASQSLPVRLHSTAAADA